MQSIDIMAGKELSNCVLKCAQSNASLL